MPQAINTGDLIFSLSRVALHRLTDLGFSDAKVLRLMRLYDETCVMLCEGQYIDIATSASDEPMTVELYFDMIGRKTAALISASIEAGALLATDDESVITGYRRFGWSLGLAFQLNDDLLGSGGRSRRPARSRRTSPGTRRRCRCSTRSRTPRRSTASGSRCCTRGRARAGGIEEVVAILERSGARDFTRSEARRHRDDAWRSWTTSRSWAMRRGAARRDHPLGDQR